MTQQSIHSRFYARLGIVIAICAFAVMLGTALLWVIDTTRNDITIINASDDVITDAIIDLGDGETISIIFKDNIAKIAFRAERDGEAILIFSRNGGLPEYGDGHYYTHGLGDDYTYTITDDGVSVRYDWD